MAAAWMIYGANGYIGRLIAEEAVRRGETPVLAGRDRAEVVRLGSRLDLPVRIFPLDTPNGIAANLKGVDVVLHCAGPFVDTSAPMLAGCMRAGTHYLDLSGDISTLTEILGTQAARIRSAGIMAVPGVGFEVAPTDCLSALLHERLPHATVLRLGIRFEGGAVAPSIAQDFFRTLAGGGWVRAAGALAPVPVLHECVRLPFTGEASPAVAVPRGDLVTAYHTTGIPDIIVYLGLPWMATPLVSWLKYVRRMHSLVNLPLVQGLLQRKVHQYVREPVPSLRRRGRVTVWGQVETSRGAAAAMRLKGPDGYTLAVASALAAVSRVRDMPLRPGSYTPSMTFGPGFVSALPGVQIEEIRPCAMEQCEGRG